MIEPLQLGSVSPKKTAIYTQSAGEQIPYKDLSPVSRARLGAMYKIWLDYLTGEMGKIEAVGPSRGVIDAEMIVNEASEKTTE